MPPVVNEYLARLESAFNAIGAVFNGLRTGAAVPARDVVATIIVFPLILWVIFLAAKPRRARRPARR